MSRSVTAIRIVLSIAVGIATLSCPARVPGLGAQTLARRAAAGRCTHASPPRDATPCDSQGAPAPQTIEANAREPGDDLVALGSALFRSTALSGPNSVSCSTCHVPALGFSGDRPLASNVDGTTRTRRTPTLFGVAAEKALLWDGRVGTTAAAIENALGSSEMAIDWPVALSRLETESVVSAADGSHAGGLTRDVAVRALVAYVDEVSAVETRFDRFREGEQSALSDEEKAGFRIFTHKAHCSSCHLVDGDRSPFTDGRFHDDGITEPSGDLGRSAVTGAAVDVRAFKTPSLRGVALRPYLMHDGSYTSLRSVIAAYDRAGGVHVDPRIKPLFLTNGETDALISFLGALNPIASTR